MLCSLVVTKAVYSLALEEVRDQPIGQTWKTISRLLFDFKKFFDDCTITYGKRDCFKPTNFSS